MSRNSMKAAVLACASLPLFAASAEQLNVKTGLWEITSVTRMSGLPPLPKELMDKLTPQQRAAMAAEAKADAAGAPSKDTSRECVTQKDLDQPFESANMEHCKPAKMTTTRTTQEARIVCDGEHKGSGVFRISAPTPETMNGTLDLKIGEGADAFTLKGQLSGRWLGADCGDEADDDVDDSTDQDDANYDEPSDDQEEEEE